MFLQKKVFSKHRSSIVSSESLNLDFVIIFPERHFIMQPNSPKFSILTNNCLSHICSRITNNQFHWRTNEYSRINEKHTTHTLLKDPTISKKNVIALMYRINIHIKGISFLNFEPWWCSGSNDVLTTYIFLSAHFLSASWRTR